MNIFQTSEITSIQPVGLKRVFDLEVPGHHNYYANGILAHNCSYHDLLDYYGKKYNDEFYKVKDTFITYKHRRLLLYPAGPNKKTLRGRCLTGSTLINTNYGFVKLQELISDDGQLEVNDLKIDSHLGMQEVSHSYKDVTNQLIRVTTENGFTVEGTPEHPMYVIGMTGYYEWAKLEDIKPGMMIVSRREDNQPSFGNLTAFTAAQVGQYVNDADQMTDIPLELRTGYANDLREFIDRVIVSRSSAQQLGNNEIEINITMQQPELLSQFQVILLHAFDILAKKTAPTVLVLSGLDASKLLATFPVCREKYANLVKNDTLLSEARHATEVRHEVVASVIEIASPVGIDIYDVTVPSTHAFTANGLVSHNTRFFCLHGDTLVSTNKGLIPVSKISEELSIGPIYANCGNQKRKIQAIFNSGHRQMVTLELANGTRLNLTGGHEVRIITSSGMLDWKPAGMLNSDDYVAVSYNEASNENQEIRFDAVDRNQYPTAMSEDLARLIAYLQLYSKIKRDHVEVKLKTADVTELMYCFEALFPAGLSLLVPSDRHNIFHITNPVLLQFLIALGVYGETLLSPSSDKVQAKVQSVASAILKSSHADQRAYLQVVFDKATVTVRSAQHRDSLMALLSHVGIEATAADSDVSLTKIGFAVLHDAQSKEDKQLHKLPTRFSYAPVVYAKSEYNECDERVAGVLDTVIDKGLIFVRVRAVLNTGMLAPTYDIAVDSNDRAFAANGIIVHNSAIDEIGWFDNQNDGKVKMDATQVYVALDRSLLTVRASANRLIKQGFDDIPHGYAFNVSSPASARDKIMELVAQSRNSKKVFGFKRATWEMNPNITKDDLSEEYAKNPQDAERDYGCNPPLSDNAFIPSFSSIENCFIGKKNKIRYKFAQKTAKDGSVTRYAKIDEVSKSTKPNVMAIDAGHCVTGDTLIPTNCGLLAIKDFPSRFGFAWSEAMPSVNLDRPVFATGAHDKNHIATWHYKGVKPVATVETDSGHSITATLNHLQLVLSNFKYQWIKVENLMVGDLVCFNPRQPASEEFDTKHESSWYAAGLGVGEMLAENWWSPPFNTELYAASRNAQLSFVAGLLDANLFEAAFSTSKNGCILSLYHPRMTMDFVKGLQKLFDSWGIFCEVPNKKDAYLLMAASVKDFFQLLHSRSKFLMSRRKEFTRLKSCAGFRTSKLLDLVRAKITKENLDLSLLVMRQVPAMFIYEQYKLGTYNSHLLMIRQLLGAEFADNLTEILSRGYSYSAITSIAMHKEPQKVYDLSIADSEDHAYTANGMVIHNTNNSFSMVCAHEHEGVPIITCVMEVMPNPGAPLNHALIFREAMHEVIKERNVKVLIADRWQSIKLLQDAELEFEEQNLMTKMYSLRYDDFWIIKQTLFDGEVIFPRLSRSIEEILKYDQSKYPYCFTDPIEHLALQMITVRDLGNAVDKGDGLTDDSFRASCLAMWALQAEEFFEVLHGEGQEEVKSVGALGYMVSRSGGGAKAQEVGMTSAGKALGYMSGKR